MLYFLLTVFPALVVFIGRLPATVRRVRAQREALRPVQPVARTDHLPCVLNTIGAALTEFFLLGLLVLAVFIGTSAAFGTLDQAPDLTTGIRHLSLGAVGAIIALGVTIAILVNAGTLARYVLLFGGALVILYWMVMSSAGDQAPAILLFAALAVGAPTLLVAVLRLFS
ncbi:MAG: hypothetical protein ACR2RA_00375 [Geminicoccaceae bacterium]